MVQPDPSLQWDALKSKVEKWLKNDNEFAFRFNSFVYREGCDHNIVTDENVLALWKFLVGESRK